MNTIIEVKKWADSQAKYTKCIMVHHELIDANSLIENFCKNRNLSFFNEEAQKTILSSKTTEFVKYLTSIGFRKLTTTAVLFND